MTAELKVKILRSWTSFLKNDLAKYRFPVALYLHLRDHCDFTAQSGRDGFFAVYFARPGAQTLRLLEQFDPDGLGLSVEHGDTLWLTDTRWSDINGAMREATRPFLAKLRETTVRAIERDQAAAGAVP